MPKIINQKRKYLENGGSYYYDKKSENWFYEYKITKDGVTLKRKQLRAKSESEIKRKIRDFEEELQNGNSIQILTFKDLVKLWYANHTEGNVAENTMRFYKDKTDCICDKFGSRPVTSIRIGEIEAFLNNLSSFGGKYHQGLAPISVNGILKLIHNIYEFAIQHNYATTNPAKGIRSKKDTHRNIQQDSCILDEAEMKQVLKTAKEGKYTTFLSRKGNKVANKDSVNYNLRVAYLTVLLGFSTGMRFGELRGLRRESIDIEHNKINVTHQLLRIEIMGKMPKKTDYDKLIAKVKKTGSRKASEKARKMFPFKVLKTKNSKRVIDIDPMVTKEIIDFLDYQDAYASNHSKFKNDWGLLLSNSLGQPINEQNFRRRYFNKMLSAAGVDKRLTLHQMRHTHASLLLNNGVDIAVVSRRLGHANPSTTYNIYIHVLPKAALNAGNVWSKIMNTTNNAG